MEEYFSSNDDFLQFIFEHYSDDIFRLCFTYVKRKDLAEDLTQEIFLKCYKNYHKYEGRAAVKTWVYRIAINHCKDYLKSGYYKYIRLSEKVISLMGSSSESTEDLVLEKDASSELTDGLLELPVKYREVLVLYYFKEFRIKEIAEAIKVNENTVKSRMRKAKNLLKQSLQKRVGGMDDGKKARRNGEDFLY